VSASGRLSLGLEPGHVKVTVRTVDGRMVNGLLPAQVARRGPAGRGRRGVFVLQPGRRRLLIHGVPAGVTGNHGAAAVRRGRPNTGRLSRAVPGLRLFERRRDRRMLIGR